MQRVGCYVDGHEHATDSGLPEFDVTLPRASYAVLNLVGKDMGLAIGSISVCGRGEESVRVTTGQTTVRGLDLDYRPSGMASVAAASGDSGIGPGLP